MNLFRFLNRAIDKMKWQDISMLKLSVFFFTLFLVTAWGWFSDLVLNIPWYWHLLLGVVFALPLLYKLLVK